MERVSDKVGNAAQAGTFAAGCDPPPKLAGVTTPVEVNRQARPRLLRNNTELFGQCLWSRSLEAAQHVDRHWAITSRIFSADGIRSVHGGPYSLISEGCRDHS